MINKESRRTYVLLFLVGLYLTFNFIGEVLVLKLLKLGPIYGPGGLVILPLVFLVEDVIAELFGYQISKYLLWIIFITSIIFAFSAYAIVHLPSPVTWHYQSDFDLIFDPIIKTAPMALFASFIGRFININLIVRLKFYTKGKYFWMRSVISTFIGSLVALTLFFVVAFIGQYPLAFLIKLILSDFTVRMCYAIFGGAIISLFIHRLKEYLEIDPYESKIDFNPFKIA